MYVIYKIINQFNGKCYVGYTKKSLQKRLEEHFRDSKFRDTKFYRAIRKYGTQNFIISPINEVTSLDEAYKIEQNEITSCQSIVLGYTTHVGGNGGHTGAYHKVGRKGKDNPMYGVSPTNEQRVAQSQKIKAWLETPEGIKSREASRQRWESEANPGKRKSEITRQRISAARIGQPNKLKGLKRGPMSEDQKKLIQIKSREFFLKSVIKCPRCGLVGKHPGNMKRYHFDACKKEQF